MHEFDLFSPILSEISPVSLLWLMQKGRKQIVYNDPDGQVITVTVEFSVLLEIDGIMLTMRCEDVLDGTINIFVEVLGKLIAGIMCGHRKRCDLIAVAIFQSELEPVRCFGDRYGEDR